MNENRIYALPSYSFPAFQQKNYFAAAHKGADITVHVCLTSFMLNVLVQCGRNYRFVEALPFFHDVFSRSSCPSSAGKTGSSPCSMPLWSRSCCMNRAWPHLPRSWQNLKPSQEVFARQDLIKAEKNVCVTFQFGSVK